MTTTNSVTLDDIDTLSKEVELGARGRSESSRPLSGEDSKVASPFWFQLTTAILIVILFILVILQFGHDHDDDSPQNQVVMSTSPALDGYEYIGAMHAGQGEWVDKLDSPVPTNGRSDLQAVACGGKMFLLGGHDGTTPLDLNLEFDPIFENYEERAPMPTPRYRFGAACSGGIVYVVGGFSSSEAGDSGESIASMDAYDVANDAWITTPLASMQAPRGDIAMASVGSQLFAFGGYGFQYSPADTVTEIYDIATDSWTYGEDLPSRRGDAVAVAVGTDIYVLGGWVDNYPSFNPSTSVDRYDTTRSEGSWTSVADMQVARGDCAVAAVGDKIYIIGGETAAGGGAITDWDQGFPLHDVEQYDIANDVWVRMAPIPAPRFRFAAAAWEETIFTFGGHQQDVETVDTVQAFYYVDRPNVFLHKSQ